MKITDKMLEAATKAVIACPAFSDIMSPNQHACAQDVARAALTAAFGACQLPMPDDAVKLAKLHDWCPACKRGWSIPLGSR